MMLSCALCLVLRKFKFILVSFASKTQNEQIQYLYQHRSLRCKSLCRKTFTQITKKREGRKTHCDFPGLPLCSQHLGEGTKWEISASPFCPKLKLSIIRVVRNSLSCGSLVCAPFLALNETLKQRYYLRLINIAALNIAGTSNGSKVATTSPDTSF